MIFPTILEKNVEEALNKVELVSSFTNFTQIDIVDRDISAQPTFHDISTLDNANVEISYELDLMMYDAANFLQQKYKKVTKICLYSQNAINIFANISKSKELGYETGISIHPDQEIEDIEALLNYIDYVQFFTVKPGAQGQPFIPTVLAKIENFIHKHPDIQVQVDGGINQNTIDGLLEVGVKNMAVGSAIFTSVDPKQTFINLNERLKNE